MKLVENSEEHSLTLITYSRIIESQLHKKEELQTMGMQIFIWRLSGTSWEILGLSFIGWFGESKQIFVSVSGVISIIRQNCPFLSGNKTGKNHWEDDGILEDP